ncbi:hypothetical protein RhiirA4_427766 [Rhizophagus irregularis]|uniref:Uncharacterized protein n=1 Tax=Rhizophagus irregularis TaxID=588596 RepID=A0A2I1HA73_9GLOM|nr:hypothetical protein RhiirA4_427766 [Rhizophagus irregularis]
MASKKTIQNDQHQKNNSNSDKATIEEVYGTDEDGAPDRIHTKRTKIDDKTKDIIITSQNENDMAVDPPNVEENPNSSEVDIPSRDKSNDINQTPINDGSDNMHIDQHVNHTNGEGSASAPITQQVHKVKMKKKEKESVKRGEVGERESVKERQMRGGRKKKGRRM